MALSNEDILNAIAEMSVMDVVELVEAMEEKFGVSAAAAVAAAPAAGGDAGEAAEEQTEFDVILKAAGGAKLAVVKLVKELTGKEAILSNIVNPAILGGFILRVGDIQYDASIANKLSVLKRHFSA